MKDEPQVSSNQKVYSSGNDGRILLHDIRTGETLRSWTSSGPTGPRHRAVGAVYNLAVSVSDLLRVIMTYDLSLSLSLSLSRVQSHIQS